MATLAQFRRLALAQPEAEEKSHFGHPDFRVRNKIFAGLQPEHGQGVLKLPPELMWELTRQDEGTFGPAPGFERGGWTLVTLSRAPMAQLRELMGLAWRTVAPKRLATADGPPGRPAPIRRRRPRRKPAR